jgi:DNA polymerase-1
MTRWIWDIEADNLLRDVKQIWCHVFLNINTGEKVKLRPGDTRWRELMEESTLIVGHNILGYDFTVLEKLYGFRRRRDLVVHDTFIMSLVLDYNRFPGGQHSLENWGKALGYEKIHFDDFSRFSEEMLTYCERDVDLNYKIYQELLISLKKQAEKNPIIKTTLRVEHFVAEWSARAELFGWPFDRSKAEQYFEEMGNQRLAAEKAILPMLGKKTVAIDKVKGTVDVKEPKWTKKGYYDQHTANNFGIDPILGLEPDSSFLPEEAKLFRPIMGPYCRVVFEDLKLSSSSDVKLFLFRNGWEPSEFNYKRDSDGSIRKTSPKITPDDLELLRGNGKLYADYLSTTSRYNVLKTWLENLDDNNRLHGSCFTIGTPSMRSRHSGIANIPGVEAPWGHEIRSLFTCSDGHSFIGADSSGNQARGLAHYLKSPEYTDLLLNGDVHSYNAEIATSVLNAMGITKTVERAQAKRLLYAFLFGASGKKLWSYIFGTQDPKLGNKFKAGFTKAVPGFENLLKKLDNIYGATKQFSDPGYIIGLGGNRIYVDSFHKLLVYLLQAAEKATCGAAVMLTIQGLEDAKIPYEPFIMYHDEEDFQTPTEYSQQAAAIAKNAFKEGPKLFGVEIMDGEAKIGKDWAECH